MSRYNTIRRMDISNGPGVRVSIFFQGCHFHCKDCFNEETWDFEKGEEFTNKEIDLINELASKEYIKGLSVLGGEPLNPKNLDGTLELLKAFKEKHKDKTIWLWTGYTYENLDDNQKKVLDYLDVLVDGQFKVELKNLKLKYSGSSNQRVIDIKETNKQGKLILIDNL